jgi:type II secretory pathway component GspD/PulD (secretin)
MLSALLREDFARGSPARNWMTTSVYFRRFLALAGALCLVAGQVPAQSAAPQSGDAKSLSGPASKLLQSGQKAEKTGDWQAAYDAYSQALALAPHNKEAEFLTDTARFHIVQRHIDAAERDYLEGQQAQAEAELHAAIQLDPTYTVAAERLAQIKVVDPAQQRAPGEHLQAPVTVHAQPGKRSFDFHGDTQMLYREVARQFGVIAQFDPELLTGRPIHLRVPDVDFETAMMVVADQTHTFWVPSSEHEFLVADDSAAKHKQFDPLAVRTFILSSSDTDTQMTDTLRAIREIVGITRATLNTSTRELTVRDTPQNVAVADQLLQQLEQGRGELVLEIELLTVDRNAARQLGIAVPTTASVVSPSAANVKAAEAATTPQALLTVIQSIFGSTGGGALGGLLPPLVAFGGGSSIFFSTLANTQANFLQTYSLVHSANRMLLRAQDGQPASFFVGEHYPIDLSLLSTNLATTVLTAAALQQTNLTAGNAPSDVIAVSLRGNGILDLVDTNQTDNTISVFLGNGDGTFAVRANTSVGTAPVALVAGDFNGDGKQDLAVVNQNDNSILILLGNGDGTFTTGGTITTGTTPSAIVAADFNGDGHLDLAVANQGDNTVSIFLGDGLGGFTAAPTSTIPTGAGPIALAVSDFNADSKLDLAVANTTDSTVSIFLGNGDGTFTLKAGYPTGTTPTSITVADFNADSRPDLAISNFGANTFSIFPGNGDGTFGAKTDFQTGTGPSAIVAGDFNGDGIPDVIVANKTDNTISVFLGGGQITFNTPLVVPVATGPVALAAADFNGDTLLDLAVAAQTGNVITTILNSASLNQAAASAAQTPYPGAQYEDIGLKVKATPHINVGGDVTLNLSFEIRSLSGSNINGIPIISNETLDQIVRVKENETTLLTGLLDKQLMTSISGWPGLGEIPAAGNLAATHNTNDVDTEILFVITPRLLRQIPHPGHAIYAGPGSGGTTTGARPGPGQP